MKTRTLVEKLWLPQSRENVFPFFADAGNLDAITPPWLHFRVLTPPPFEMRVGALIEYRLRIRGVPVFWRTEIAEWNPPFSFVDRQLKGPYKLWVHTHTFEEKAGGALMRDHVEYAVPGGLFEPIVHSLFVKNDVRRIFDYRSAKLRERFGDSLRKQTGSGSRSDPL